MCYLQVNGKSFVSKGRRSTTAASVGKGLITGASPSECCHREYTINHKHTNDVLVLPVDITILSHHVCKVIVIVDCL